MALLDVQVAVLANQNLNFLTTGVPPKRYGNAHPNIVPYQVFKTRDGSFVLAVGNDQQFRKFCAAAGLAELATDGRFVTNTDRLKNRDQLIPLLDDHLVRETTQYWISILEPVGVPCAPINRLDEVFAHPQVIHREMQIKLPHSAGTTAPLVANPIKFSGTKIEYTKSPPRRGEDTAYILKSVLKYDSAAIQNLNERQIIDIGTS
jgi:formyl-CoA transferase